MTTLELLDSVVYNTRLFLAEKEAAYFIRRLLKIKVESIPSLTEGLKHKQPSAVALACESPVFILTGPPGTGKTTTLKKIVDSFQSAGLRGRIFCPTGKAAKRADEVVNKDRSFVNTIKCSTVHAGLQWDASISGFSFNRCNRLRDDYIIVDEFSMLDAELLRDLVESIEPGKTRLIFCGDQYQLPSVGPGNVGRDLISSGVISTIELDVVLRTGANSGITYNANMILSGQDICKTDPHTGELFTDFFFVGKPNQSETVKAICKYITEDLPEKRKMDSLRDIQLMCPGKNALCGTRNMNSVLRDMLLSNKDKRMGGFCVGDKVIHLVNDRQKNLVNGDVGYVIDLVKGDIGSHLVIDFGPKTGPNSDGLVDFKGEAFDRISLAYALTVHKSQGSESPVSIMPIHTCHTMLLTNNLVYTGLTRGKSLGIMTGDIEALRRAIRNKSPDKRFTQLAQLLKM